MHTTWLAVLLSLAAAVGLSGFPPVTASSGARPLVFSPGDPSSPSPPPGLHRITRGSKLPSPVDWLSEAKWALAGYDRHSLVSPKSPGKRSLAQLRNAVEAARDPVGFQKGGGAPPDPSDSVLGGLSQKLIEQEFEAFVGAIQPVHGFSLKPVLTWIEGSTFVTEVDKETHAQTTIGGLPAWKRMTKPDIYFIEEEVRTMWVNKMSDPIPQQIVDPYSRADYLEYGYTVDYEQLKTLVSLLAKYGVDYADALDEDKVNHPPDLNLRFRGDLQLRHQIELWRRFAFPYDFYDGRAKEHDLVVNASPRGSWLPQYLQDLRPRAKPHHLWLDPASP